MTLTTIRNAAAAIVAALALASCMLQPGRFTSDLTLNRDGTFAFRYAGEIVLLPLALPPSAARNGSSSTDGSRTGSEDTVEQFVEDTCTTPAGESRACTAREIADQRARWQAGRGRDKAARQAEEARNAKAMAALMGGLDPTDPRAAQEFAARLSRQQGWTSVVSRGNGRFDVVYETTGRLDHDFSFPVIERLPMVVPFVTVLRRKDGTVRIDAPAFSPAATNPHLPGLVDAAAGKDAPVVLDGRFAIRTDGEVLANNTDEGPHPDPAGAQRLSWKVDARTAAAPTALVRLAR
ncbi:hypothetical protein [Novosphingobium huizhouense]|uniref:hypothetical protein n=1 Tax=Novosphingobium huizhouense TaxID=2866625 RepID=UPI001CD86FFB|nr:hypothetical protein [Novosphingobium huizhouense]